MEGEHHGYIERIFHGSNVQKCLVSKILEQAGHVYCEIWENSLMRRALVAKPNKTRQWKMAAIE